jgi:predicted PolB exonuclease-like 3'-5' exonuclease
LSGLPSGGEKLRDFLDAQSDRWTSFMNDFVDLRHMTISQFSDLGELDLTPAASHCGSNVRLNERPPVS